MTQRNKRRSVTNFPSRPPALQPSNVAAVPRPNDAADFDAWQPAMSSYLDGLEDRWDAEYVQLMQRAAAWSGLDRFTLVTREGVAGGARPARLWNIWYSWQRSHDRPRPDFVVDWLARSTRVIVYSAGGFSYWRGGAR